MIPKEDIINQKYNHSGKWEKNIKSIFDPEAKITWPQFIVEMVIYNRSSILKDYPKILMGKGWSDIIRLQVRKLNQQAPTLCNYFPHPIEEPLVIVAFKNFFRQNKVLKIGQYRATRHKNGKINVTKDEIDVASGIAKELDRLIQQRNSFKNSINNSLDETKKDIKSIKFGNKIPKQTNNLQSLIDLENNIKKQ